MHNTKNSGHSEYMTRRPCAAKVRTKITAECPYMKFASHFCILNTDREYANMERHLFHSAFSCFQEEGGFSAVLFFKEVYNSRGVFHKDPKSNLTLSWT